MPKNGIGKTSSPEPYRSKYLDDNLPTSNRNMVSENDYKSMLSLLRKVFLQSSNADKRMIDGINNILEQKADVDEDVYKLLDLSRQNAGTRRNSFIELVRHIESVLGMKPKGHKR